MASWSQYLSDIRVAQLPAPYFKSVPENAVGYFQLLLSAKYYIL